MNFQRYFLNSCIRNRNILLKLTRNISDDLSRSHKASNLEKKMLVWTKTGNYKTIEEVPEYVGQQVMEKARNRMRIKLANIMMLLTALGCVAMVILGKRAHERGESVEKMGREWHERINKSAAAEVQNK